MKYIVMQCTKGYSVLMDEEGKFVFAANLNYKTGQTVTNPVIMTEKYKDGKPVMTIIKTVVAAVACIGVISIPCYSYYNKNLKPCSTVTLASDTSISMTLNSSGKVLSIESNNDYGTKIIEKVDIKGKDNVEAANEILKAEISEGYISAGDTVDVYVEGKSEKNLEVIKSKLEAELPKHDIKVNIHDEKKPPKIEDKIEDKKDKLPHEKPIVEITTAVSNDDKAEKPVPTIKTKPVEKPVPPAPKDEPVVTPSAPAAPPTPPTLEETPVPPAENAVPPHQKPDDKGNRLPHQNDKDKIEPNGVHAEMPNVGNTLPHEKNKEK